ncbi:hypothetical protein GGI15_004040 [Coemansia interrupta]|uniref:Uncharacterized protein n=1 Tax=Coemansia interrupta TaxID=1126814 RepID=A0A9W8LGE8_9FUNG|nr:hypothetical protein GGI15_004040 [Coemansia interrupta]
MDADIDYLLGSGSAGDMGEGPLTLARAQQLSQALSRRLTHAARELRLTTHDAPGAFLQTTASAAHATHQIALLLSGVDRLQQLADTRHAHSLSSARAAQATAQAAQKLQQSTELLEEALRPVAQACAALRSARQCVARGRPVEAAGHVVEAWGRVGALGGARVAGMLGRECRAVAKGVSAMMRSELDRWVAVEAREDVVSVTCAEDLAGLVQAARRMDEEVGHVQETAADDDCVAGLSAAADAALGRSAGDRVDADAGPDAGGVLRALGLRLIDMVVRPVLQHSALSYATTDATLTIALGRAPDADAAEPTCQAILSLVAHVEQHMGRAPAPWTPATLAQISGLAAQRYTADGPPDTRTVQALVALEQALGRRSTRAVGQVGRELARAQHSRAAEALGRARALAQDPALALHHGAAPWPHSLPGCAVSRAAVEILGVLDERPAEGARALMVYLAAGGRARAGELRGVPGVQLLWANDCLLLACGVGRAVSAGDPLAALCVRLADAAHSALVERQGAELARLAAPPEIFTGVLEQDAGPARDRALRRTRGALGLLRSAVQPPMAAEPVGRSLVARCADRMFAEVVRSILQLDDVGAEESRVLAQYCRGSRVLAQYCRGVWGLEGMLVQRDRAEDEDEDEDDLLLLDGDHRADAAASRDADRLRQLADVLELPRADILARRRAGLLANFTVAELTHLVKALFSSTPERQRDIVLLQTL